MLTLDILKIITFHEILRFEANVLLEEYNYDLCLIFIYWIPHGSFNNLYYAHNMEPIVSTRLGASYL